MDNENLDLMIRKMLEDGDTFCDHNGSLLYKTEALGGWHRAYCPRCLLWSLAKPSVMEAEQSFREETRRKLQRYEEIKMSVADYKRGVEDGTAAFGSEHVFPGTSFRVHTPWYDLLGEPLGVRIEQLLKERRKKLLTKKVTKWTGIITSEYSGLPTILELCDTEEEVKEFLAKNRRPLTKAIPIEIETEI